MANANGSQVMHTRNVDVPRNTDIKASHARNFTGTPTPFKQNIARLLDGRNKLGVKHGTFLDELYYYDDAG